MVDVHWPMDVSVMLCSGLGECVCLLVRNSPGMISYVSSLMGTGKRATNRDFAILYGYHVAILLFYDMNQGH